MTEIDDACDLINKTMNYTGEDCVTPEIIEETLIKRGSVTNSFREPLTKRDKVMRYFRYDMNLTDRQRKKLWKELKLFFKMT